MTMPCQQRPVQVKASANFILTNKEAENGRQTDVTYAMENSDNEDCETLKVESDGELDTEEVGDSGIQSAPFLPSVDTDTNEIRDSSSQESSSLSDVDTDQVEMRDSGIQKVPTLSDVDADLSEFYPEADVKSEEEFSIVDADVEQVADTTREEYQPTQASHVVVCSSGSFQNAEAFQQDLVGKSPNADVHVIACNDKDDFETLLTAYTSIDKVYILADSSICDAMLRKKSLHESISDLFEKLVETSTVYLVRRGSDEDNRKYDLVKAQLPDNVREDREILISTENREFIEQFQPQGQPGRREANDTENNPEDVSQQNNVMIGSNCKLTLNKTGHQIVAIRQDGTQNIVNVQIVPATTTSQLTVVIKTDPSNPELERNIIHEVTEDLEFINICLRYFDGNLIQIKNGSIIIEFDIAPGTTIGFDYLQGVLGSVFQGNIKEVIPEGTKFTVDADVQNVIPVSKLQEYYVGYAMRDEDLHANCVNKDKYEDALKQLETVTRKFEDLKKTIEHGSGGLKVTIISGDITNEKTDVVVNSTNSKLLLSDGDLSGDILQAAGASIQKECSKQNPSPLKAGDLAVTRGGNLDCKEIYHVVLSDKWLSRQKDTELSLREVLNKCLKKADKSGYGSISFPALGMGKLQYKPETVVPLMYDVIMKFKPTALEEVRFVILPKFQEIRRVFSETEIVRPFGRSQSEPADLTWGKHPIKQKAEVDDQIHVKWIKGDISQQKVDMVVNTTDKGLNLGGGPISQAVVRVAGMAVQDECRKYYPQGIEEGELAITSGGRLCRFICHVSLWQWTDECLLEKPFLELIESILEKARERQLRSIAFPMLGTGTLKYPAEVVVKWLSDAFDKETRHTSSLRTIYVVVHPGDAKKIEALKHLGKLADFQEESVLFC